VCGELSVVIHYPKVGSTRCQKQEKKKRRNISMNTNYLDITLQGSDDKEYTLREFKGQKIVLYFYPKDNTSGCTLESKDFTCLKDQYAEKGYKVIGVSKDSVKSHKNFILKQELDLLLLADVEQELIKSFDVLKEKSMYGKKYMGVVRSTFILDEEGNIVNEYRNVKANGHAESLLKEL
jgi:peroxiredoxin Q/BCP